MRSFRLLVLFLLLNVVSSVCLSAPVVIKKGQEQRLFTVTLPYHNGVQTIERTLSDAMAILLVRLTGQKDFLTSRVAQVYLNNPKAWLKTYDITPRVEEGVTVGENIIYRFLGEKLRQEFHQRFVPIWPLSARPNTLVMGTLVQGDTLIKLDSNALRYRLDAEFRHYPNRVELPITVPASLARVKGEWILPVESAQRVLVIQEILARLDLPYLLSFKVVMKGGENNRLTWMLSDDSGTQILSGTQSRGAITTLTEQMFDQVMEYYAQRYHSKPKENTEGIEAVYLTIKGIESARQIVVFEQLLASKPDQVRSVKLVSMQAGQVQYRITLQTNYQSVLNWIQDWPQSSLVVSDSEQKRITINVRPEFFLPQETFAR